MIEEQAEMHNPKMIPRSRSAEGMNKLLTQQVEPAKVSVGLYVYGKHNRTIRVLERITREDLQREASKVLIGRVRVVSERYSLTEDSVVDCIPSFVGAPAIPDASHAILIPYLVHGGWKYPVAVWPDTSMDDLMRIASDIMMVPFQVHTGTRTDPVRR
jgi:hypothetical protein